MNRNARLFSLMQGKVDAVLVANGSEGVSDYNFRYFVNPSSGIFEHSFAVVTQKRTYVFTSILERSALEGLPVTVYTYRDAKQLEKLLSSKLRGYKSIGINRATLPVSYYNLIRKCFKGKLKDCSQALMECRGVKDDEEIRRIAEACRIASRVADMVPSMLREGMTEKELATLITKAMYDEGGEGNSFSPIVSFGKTSAIPHYFPGKVKLRKGHFVLTDFGCRYSNYCSDITRTFIFGRAVERQKELYETVLTAQTEAIKQIGAGAVAGEVDAAARRVIDARFKGRFIHSLGHGLGLQVHDGLPVLARGVDKKLEKNMVVTVEPGAYIPGFGGVRIEDDVVVTGNGVKVLTNAKKELIEV